MTCVVLATEEHVFSGALRIEEKVKSKKERRKKNKRERRAVKFNSVAFVFMGFIQILPRIVRLVLLTQCYFVTASIAWLM